MLLAAYCILIVIASVLGGLVPLYVRLTHRRMQIGLSFVSGVMLGVAMLHLWPHAWVEFAEAGRGGSLDAIALWTLAGFLAMFLLERFFCFHHHEESHDEAHAPRNETAREDAAAGAQHQHQHHHHHHHSLGWTGAAIGMTVHALLEGAALAASIEAESHGHDAAALSLAGFGTFLIIVLHKPFDSLTIGALMAGGAHSARRRHLINIIFALIVPIGAVAFMLGLTAASAGGHLVVGSVLAFSAGMFLCIALSDLLPELQFHQHDRLKLTAALIAGLAAAYAIGIFEGAAHEHHAHGEDWPAVQDHEHDH